MIQAVAAEEKTVQTAGLPQLRAKKKEEHEKAVSTFR
jgi:hypothetical protein